ncbi:Ca2+-transporting ATPase [Ruminococcus sp. YE71]|uniref:cation-translocating P-type ATPase n=1 Tax=unclassified Ruminococcus TaxID=2608920 RepID=UPI0008881D35|nr:MULTISPECIES: cation-translocating P-type ATPase [unclassified Ruminococcus]SDA12175.1 Ca2+-transporting ATPase [Ruminococcus sp. YE78]SFW16474.1 Ca2+-transporting ATPase [Ruminococcus sp. YE71]
MADRYRQTPEQLYDELNSSATGLTSEGAKENAAKYGRNELTQGKKKTPLQIFLSQFADFLVIILIIAAIVSAFTHDVESTIVIVAVITMNAIIGTIQTLKAERSLDNLKKLNSPNAKVVRNGEKLIVPSEEVTVGDVVILEAGDSIPADGRLIESASLQTNESALTGESLNIDKSVDNIDREVPLADRKNMVFSGSFVTYGRGSYIVTDIGMNTEVGKIATLIQNADERKTPLQNTLDNFGKKLSVAILFICALVFGLSLMRAKTINFESVMASLMFAIALAVAAIPEALSSIVTIVLSFGTQKMSKENAIMRKLQAVEGLGSVSVICSDKTGTLTQNKMTVRRIVCDGHRIVDTSVDVSNVHEKDLIISSVLCNDSSCKDGVDIGDPTETALIHFAHKVGLSDEEIRENYPRISEIPFDSDRKLMSTLNVVNGKHIMYTKGATDVLIDRMNVTESEKNDIRHQVEHMSKKGLRILCFAYKEFDGDTIDIPDENDLEYMGLIAMMDPPREESKQAVAECKSAGIKPVMITGDHLITASAIAKEIGILESFDEAVEGSALDQYTDEQLVDFVVDKSVYARVTPEHKIRIVKAWQTRNNIVAMTGDGVNDAPALKQADVGVAMGITGTEVSKDAAAMVLADDNFATIVKAVKNGRNIYDNIKKSILFLLSGNLAGIIAVLFNSIAGFAAPFAAIHLLFINLLTDSLPAIALGLEPHSDEVMKRKPRPANESIMTKQFLFGVSYSGIIIAIATIIAFIIGKQTSNELGMTMAFATLCMSRLFHGFSAKDDEPVIFTNKFFNNKFGLLAFVAGMIFLNLVLLVPGLHSLFKISKDLDTSGLLVIYGLSICSMLVVQGFKFLLMTMNKNKA